jgi:hypothetical protein
MRHFSTLGLIAAAVLVAGCGDKPQAAGAAGARKADSQASQGPASNATYAATGNWKAGDHAAWETQIRARAQGQNEYSRSAATP